MACPLKKDLPFLVRIVAASSPIDQECHLVCQTVVADVLSATLNCRSVEVTIDVMNLSDCGSANVL